MVHGKRQLDSIGRFLKCFGEETSIVDQEMQGQSSTMKFFDESSNRCERTEIEGHEFKVRTTGFLLQLPQQRQRFLFVSAGKDRVIILRHQFLRSDPSETRTGARDDTNLLTLLSHRRLSFVF